AIVEVEVRPYGVMRDAVSQLPQAGDRALLLGRREVVEHRARHQEPRRPCVRLRLELGDGERPVEGEIDVVAEDQVAVRRRTVEAGEAVAAALRRTKQVPVVR